MQHNFKKNIVLLSYGKESEYLRAIFCILSFYAWCGHDQTKFRFLVYTDNPDFFSGYLDGYAIAYVFLDVNELEEMLQQTGFIHRRKVRVIELSFQKYPNEDLLFLDSDTFIYSDCTALVEPLMPETSYMHKREYTITEGLSIFKSYNQGEYPKRFLNYILSRDFEIGRTVETFSGTDYSWNSGVLSLHKSFSHYMKDVMTLTDGFYKSSNWFISEQLAFSFILQRKTSIKPSDHMVIHYWGLKEKALMDTWLASFMGNRDAADLHDLTTIQGLTQKWKKELEVDSILDQAAASIADHNWYYTAKKVIQLFFKKPMALRSLFHTILNIKKY
jgi:hypothetical protein